MRAGRYIRRGDADRIRAQLLEDLVDGSLAAMNEAMAEAAARGCSLDQIEAAGREAIELACAVAVERAQEAQREVEISIQ